MKTQDLLLLGIGVGIGYLAFKRYQQNKPKPETQTTEVDCETKWKEKAKSMEFSSTEAEQKSKSAFIKTCLAQYQHPLGVGTTFAPIGVGTTFAPKTQAQCEAEWNEKASTMRISQSALATAKANFMLSCTPTLIATV